MLLLSSVRPTSGIRWAAFRRGALMVGANGRRALFPHLGDMDAKVLGFQRGAPPQLLRKDLGAPLVLAKSLIAVAEQEAEPHHLPMGRLPQRVVEAEPPGEVLGRLVIGPALVKRDEPLQADEILGTQALPFEVGPVVVEAGQEFTPVKVDRLLERYRLRRIPGHGLSGRGRDVAVELGDVEPVVGGYERNVEQRGFDERLADLHILERGLDLPPGLAESTAGALLREVGPERPGDQVPGMPAVTVGD